MSRTTLLDIKDWRIIKTLVLNGDPNLRQFRTAKMIYERKITDDYPIDIINHSIIFPQLDKFDQTIIRACGKYNLSVESLLINTANSLSLYEHMLTNPYVQAQFAIYPSITKAKGKYPEGFVFPNVSETIKLFTPYSNIDALQSFVDNYVADDLDFVDNFNKNVKLHIV